MLLGQPQHLLLVVEDLEDCPYHDQLRYIMAKVISPVTLVNLTMYTKGHCTPAHCSNRQF
jgi:hypothetical protein